MHKEVLNDRQVELLPVMATFRREYYLVGGTAIALHIGHRRSIDFDMFKPSVISIEDISQCATSIFGELYSEKMFRAQMCYFEDVDYTEEVEYLISNPPSDEVIRATLTAFSKEGL